MLLWLKGLISLLAAVIALSVLVDSDWEVQHRVDIDASPDIVWQLLIDLPGYAQWNRYSPSVEGNLAVGEVVWVEAHLDNEVRRVQNYVLSIEPQRELCWGSADWYGFLANGIRCRWLSKTAGGGTELIHHEVMQGPLAWLIEYLYRPRIERGLALVDNSLATQAEKIAAQSRP
ncbi:hypothetical protein SIN8267_00685 [Sinobacterium norvegicum]|uniref:SRPBCC domain-containing protein n=1 Tax=Sinobacterium norvegicum TaxID=1641715 RepID=A0ABN8EDQ4_9GAMM|nr:SRPBCC domain-containing protein [Sinobacterium norvegicum]CAH0990591.1 hypothetical protein SIN8267_00685 [Sinobacterium norvegicum]